MATLIESDVTLRDMGAEDLPGGYALSNEQKWPHRLEDWEFLLENGMGLVAEIDRQIVGTIMSWNFGENAATVGMVIVSNACQGRGIGRKLMNAMLERLEGRSVMLNATAEGLRLYESLGFVTTGSVFQHQSSDFTVPVAELLPDERVRPMGARDWENLGAMFSGACGMERDALLKELRGISRGVVLTRDNHPVGFALLRRFGRGWSVGPVIAPDAQGARALVSHWLGKQMGKFCRLDVTGASGLSPWLAALGLPCVGEVTMMVRGDPLPAAQDAQVFALVSQALG
jgi:ribosomal protein S18 acetylase RimI-like enzyme